MSKKYNIKWRESDERTLKRAVKNFNAKIARVAKTHANLIEFQPDKASYKALRQSINTRYDFNKTIRELTNYTQRNYLPVSKNKEDNIKFKKTIDKFNKRIDYVKKKYPTVAYLQPKKISASQAAKYIGSVTDARWIIEQYDNYLKRDAYKKARKHNATRWMIEYEQARRDKVNEIRANSIKHDKNLPLKQGGDFQRYSDGEIMKKDALMGDVNDSSKRPLQKTTDTMSDTELEKSIQMTEDFLNFDRVLEKQRNMRINYITGLLEYGFLDDDNDFYNDILYYILQIDFDTFYDTVKSDVFAEFVWYRDETQEFETRLEKLRETWKKAYEQNKGE